MIAINYSRLRQQMKKYFDIISDTFETVIVTRKNGENIVMMSEDTYNNLMENAYLTSSKANLDWLMESKKQYEEGKTVVIDTSELKDE